jgi:hypothetical protein
MKRVFLLMVVSAMVVTFGFAQTPDAGSTPAPANVNLNGCLAGSDGNYTVAEDGTRQIFKISTSSVDLKPHVGHDVKLVGQKSTEPVSSGTANSSFTVTELSMISEHCAAAAAAVGALAPYPQTVIEPTVSTPPPAAPAATPTVDAAAPAAAAPSVAAASTTVSPSSTDANTVAASAPAQASAPAAVVTPPAAATDPSSTAVSAPPAAPAVEVAAPVVAASSSSTTVASPEVAARPARPSTHARKLAAAPVAADAAPAAPAAPSTNNVTPDAAAATPSPETVSPPDVTAATTVATHRAGSLTLLISFVVLVIVLGTMAPLIGRWRKRKLLEQNGAENLSFNNDESAGDISADPAITKRASSDVEKPKPSKVA